MFFTYILFSISRNKYYIGHTNDIDRRLTEHNFGFSSSTKSGIPWIIVYYKEFDSNSNAIKYELELKKKKSRKFIEKLIMSG